MEEYYKEIPNIMGIEKKGRNLSKTKVTVVSIGYTGKGDVLVQRKIERIKTLKVTILSMKKNHEYVRILQAIIKVGKFAHFYYSHNIKARGEGKKGG